MNTMKPIIILAIFSAVFLLGCTNSATGEFNLYEDAANHFSFEKPASWTQQSDPLSFARFGDLDKMSFSVSYSPGSTAGDFDKAVEDVYASFQSNGGLFNLQKENTTLAGFQAVKITSDQNLVNQTTQSLDIVRADLFIVKDTKYNRIALVSFTSKKDASGNREMEEKMLNSFKIT